MTIRSRSTTEILTSACLHDDCVHPMLMVYRTAVLIIGNTYELQATWAALWAMSIGRAEVANQKERNEYG
jgi:hypothetical protein